MYRGLCVCDTVRSTYLSTMPSKEKQELTGSDSKSSVVHTLLKLISLFLRVEIPPTGNQMSLQNCLSNLV